MTDGPGSGPAPEVAPQTGHPEIDRALAELDDLAADPLPHHHDRLARAHEALQRSLDRPDPTESS